MPTSTKSIDKGLSQTYVMIRNVDKPRGTFYDISEQERLFNWTA